MSKKNSTELTKLRRQLKVEAALDRIRDLTMKMTDSAELAGVIKVVFQEAIRLGFGAKACDLVIFDEKSGGAEFWISGDLNNEVIFARIPRLRSKYYEASFSAWQKRKKLRSVELTGKSCKAYMRQIIEKSEDSNMPDSIKELLLNLDSIHHTEAYTKHGLFRVASDGPLERNEEDILIRFAKVFEQTYTRFLDLQKAEAQAREAQIEASLEKVRSSALSMYRSDELRELVSVLYREMEIYGFATLGCELVLCDEANDQLQFWSASFASENLIELCNIPQSIHPFFQKQWKAWKKQIPRFTITLEGKQKRDFDKLIFTKTEFKKFPEEAKKSIINSGKIDVFSHVTMKYGLIETVDRLPLSEDKFLILHRFAKVFEQSYSRFLDLKKAEAQAREAQIEASLEKVRARSMGMRKSEELAEVASLLYKELTKLSIRNFLNCGFVEVIEEQKGQQGWSTMPDGSVSEGYFLPLTGDTILNERYKAWKNKVPAFHQTVGGKKLKKHQEFVYKTLGSEKVREMTRDFFPDPTIFYCFNFSNGYLHLITDSEIDYGEESLLIRFAKVFEQTYTRFLDLQKAEAQAREAQIEVALERVRARTMAMHESEELAEVAAVLFEQMTILGVTPERINVCLFKEESRELEVWSTDQKGSKINHHFTASLDEPTTGIKAYQAWKKGLKSSSIELKGKELTQWIKYVREVMGMTMEEELIQEKRTHGLAFFSHGMLITTTSEPLPMESMNLMERFADVFNLTYRRFLDLQKAEAQAREAQIEAALERVRAQTMAMHNSEDVGKCVIKMFGELTAFGVDEGTRFGIGILNQDNENNQLWTASKDGEEVKMHIGNLDMTSHPLLKSARKAWKAQVPLHKYVLEGKDLLNYYKMINSAPDYRFRIAIDKLPEREFHYGFIFDHGFFYAFSPCEFQSNLIIITQRFSSLFAQTYRRYLDLVKAEEQAREAEIELALERVRARTMGMHKSEELKDVVKMIFDQLAHLSINAEHAGIVVDYEPKKDWHFWIAETQDIPAKVTVPYLDLVWDQQFTKAKKEGKDFFTTKLNFDEKNSFYKELLPHIEGLTKKARDFYFHCPGLAISTVIEKDIGLYIENFSGTPYSELENSILKRFAKVFQQTYTRFLDLKKAEEQAREARIEAALERVRARSMAMHGSDELVEAADVMFAELNKLEINTIRIGICTIDLQTDASEIWSRAGEQKRSENRILGIVPKGVHPVFDNMVRSWKEKKPYYTNTRIGKEVKEYYTKVGPYLSYPKKAGFNKQETISAFFFKQGSINVVSHEPLSNEECQIMIRFAKAFDQAFTRFLDLQKAEAQAREAQIEAALERIRGRAMAMHHSNELLDVAIVLRKEIAQLDNLQLESSVVHLYPEDSDSFKAWYSFHLLGTASDQFVNRFADFPVNSSEFTREILKKYHSDESVYSIASKGKKLRDWYKVLDKVLPEVVEYDSKGKMIVPPILHYNFSKFSGGALMMVTHEPIQESTRDLWRRAAQVFNISYQRFLDLQKAEAQGREAQIEAALERVRSASMAMHKSEEIAQVAATLFKQFDDLGVHDLRRCVIWTLNADQTMFQCWYTTEEGQSFVNSFSMPIKGNATVEKLFEIWESRKSESIQLKGKLYTDWGKFIRKYGWRYPKGEKQASLIILNELPFENGIIEVATYTELGEADHDLAIRFTNVFEQSYTRFLDLQKAEAQAREAQVEAALERLRAAAMAMHQSDELSDTISVLFSQLRELGVTPVNTYLVLYDLENNRFNFRMTGKGGSRIPHEMILSFDDLPQFKPAREAWESGEPIIEVEYSREHRQDWLKLFAPMNKRLPKQVRLLARNFPNGIFNCSGRHAYGSLGITNSRAANEEEKQLLVRFAREFEIVYTRFLDLQKAEAQAREAQIEAALERVRTQTMAMHTSQDVGNTMALIFSELVNLGINAERNGILIMKEDENAELWTARPDSQGQVELLFWRIDMSFHQMARDAYTGWQNQELSTEYLLKGADLKAYYKGLNNSPDYPGQFDLDKLPAYEYCSLFHFTEGTLYLFTPDLVGEKNKQILIRFASIFGQTYRRYLDLQKAEAQAREAQIEAALERVRSKAMAMHSSEDLAQTVDVFFHEIKGLNVSPRRCGVTLINNESTIANLALTSATDKGEDIKLAGQLDLSGHPVLDEVYKHWQNQKEYHPILEGKELRQYYKFMNPQVKFPDFPEDTIQFGHYFYFKEGGVFAWTDKDLSNEDLEIFRKFKSVLSLTYRRYLDLKEAEAQTREAQIEASLERVRAKALAMHSSEDLSEAVNQLFTELLGLDISILRCGVMRIYDDANSDIYSYRTTENGEQVAVLGQLKLKGHPILENGFKHWKIQKEFHGVMQGESIRKYYQLVSPQLDIPPLPQELIHHLYIFYFPEGCLYCFSELKFTEEPLQIFRRFNSVLGLTFRRYLDLQDAETRTLEAIKQSSLDRVRAEIASMRTADDLNRITPLVWSELTTLGVPFFRCGVFIVDETSQYVRTFLSTPTGDSLAAIDMKFRSNALMTATVENWRKNKVHREVWDKADFTEWTNSLLDQGLIADPKTYQHGEEAPDKLVLHLVPFSQGMLYVGSTDKLKEDQIELVHSLADSFSVAYARYEDFKQLEDAKKHVEGTLSELRSAQDQLVHSEKMASLGELTAGIAHEIQNPLNFVNNFSDINKELADELLEEIEKGNAEEAKAIIMDIINNDIKILHHGKRAEEIVRSMLQHSRGSSGEKELTNINSLADEYLRLSYHGMRAKDKSFNTDFQLDLDENLPQLKVIQQDIGRVLLNLINNAFYATNEKKNATPTDYKPKVTLSTTALKDSVEIRVKDNAGGIPKKVLEKIFQPFFTTKPTGQGTGLGLSLSYDIVTKGHGGTLEVVTKEGKGSEFVIKLPVV